MKQYIYSAKTHKFLFEIDIPEDEIDNIADAIHCETEYNDLKIEGYSVDDQ